MYARTLEMSQSKGRLRCLYYTSRRGRTRVASVEGGSQQREYISVFSRWTMRRGHSHEPITAHRLVRKRHLSQTLPIRTIFSLYIF